VRAGGLGHQARWPIPTARETRLAWGRIALLDATLRLMLVLGVLLVVLGVMFIVFNRWYARRWLGAYLDRAKPRDLLWLRGGAVVSGIIMTATGVFLIARGD
jgi:vacuolar-type H+-ATPase subunit I/STV1